MVFSNKHLILAAPYSERTYWRRKKCITFEKKTQGDLLTLEEAQQIAEHLGFKKEFEEYLKNFKD